MSTAQTRSAPSSWARAQAIRPMAPTPKTRTFLPAAEGDRVEEEVEGKEVDGEASEGYDDGGHMPARREA